MKVEKTKVSQEELNEAENEVLATLDEGTKDTDTDEVKDKKDKDAEVDSETDVKEGADSDDKEGDDDVDTKDKKETCDSKKEKYKMKKESFEAFDSLIKEQTSIPEDLKSKTITMFEASVNSKIEEIVEQMEADYEASLNEAVETSMKEHVEHISDFLETCVATYFKENEVEMTNKIKVEKADAVLNGLKGLFETNYIDIDEEKIDALAQSESKLKESDNKLADIQSKLDESVKKTIDLEKQILESEKDKIFTDVTESMTDVQKEKFVKLMENVTFTESDNYYKKLTELKSMVFHDTKEFNSSVVLENDKSNDVDVSEDDSHLSYMDRMSKIFK